MSPDERAALVRRLRYLGKALYPKDLLVAAAQIESDGRKLARIRGWNQAFKDSGLGIPEQVSLDAILEDGDDTDA
jgi:hypothetical protein